MWLFYCSDVTVRVMHGIAAVRPFCGCQLSACDLPTPPITSPPAWTTANSASATATGAVVATATATATAAGTACSAACRSIQRTMQADAARDGKVVAEPCLDADAPAAFLPFLFALDFLLALTLSATAFPWRSWSYRWHPAAPRERSAT
jgi:hypothetical protein